VFQLAKKAKIGQAQWFDGWKLETDQNGHSVENFFVSAQSWEIIRLKQVCSPTISLEVLYNLKPLELVMENTDIGR
jgi:hypothetical protein